MKSEINHFLFRLAFAIVVISLTSCQSPPEKDEDSTLEHNTEQIIHSMEEGDVEVIEIDDCEYIVYKEVEGTNHAYGYMAHKGNCSNPIHCYKEVPEANQEIPASE